MKYIAHFSGIILAGLFFWGCSGDGAPAYKNASLPIEKRIDDLLKRMTIEEKAAQMDMLAANDILKDNKTLSEQQLIHFIDSMGIGSIHDFYPETAELANEVQRHAVEKTRLGIPILFIEEALHGYQGAGATAFPVPLGNASSWDTALIYDIGRVIGTEARSRGVHFVLAPNLDISRDIRWGRTEETYGEDTYLSSRIAVNMIKGMQGASLTDNNTVVAEPKHFAIHGSPESGVNAAPVLMGERDMRSTGLYVFEKAVREAGAKGIMAGYHEIDGVPMVANKWLLTDILRNEWGFDGMVVTDLGAIRNQVNEHYTSATPEEAIETTIKAGLDMQFYDYPHETFQSAIVNGVKNGTLDEKDVDRAVRNILRVKFLLGLFDNPYTDTGLSPKVYHCQAHRELALRAAHESIILLQNRDSILPLQEDVKRICVTGNLANATHTGGYSPAGAKALPVVEGLRQHYGDKANIEYVNAEVSDRFAQIDASFLQANLQDTQHGLQVEYYNNSDFSGNPVYTTTDANLSVYWHNLSPAPGVNPLAFSVRWSGYVTAPVSGLYEFDFRAENLGKLYVDNTLLLDHWNDEWKNRGERAVIRLTAGKPTHICIELAKTDENAGIWLNWRLSDASGSDLFAKIRNAASHSDVIVVVMGETREEVGESRDRHDLYPGLLDMEILRTAAQTGKPVITVMITGRPLILTEVCKLSSAILQCWFPGEATGTAVADILSGDYNPSGRLTMSFPRFHEQLPIYYSKKPSSHRRYTDGRALPLFPFGFGLSYSSYEYSNLLITPENPKTTDVVTVSCDVHNTGKTAGYEIVQLYINDKVSSIATPEILLKGFSRIFLQPDETKTVKMTLTPEHFSFVGADMQRLVEPGAFDIMVGASSEDIRLKSELMLK